MLRYLLVVAVSLAGAAGAVMVFSLIFNGAVALGGTDSCQLTADTVALSCQAGAQSDYQLALAKCENIANLAQKKACQKEALDDLNEALNECSNQQAARAAACARL